MVKKIDVLAALLAVSVLGGAPSLAQMMPPSQGGGQGAGPAGSEVRVPTIGVAEFNVLAHSKKRFLLIDVRRSDEFAAGHIPNAVLMPLDTLPNTYRQIPKGQKLVVYCRSGHRSAQAVAFLRSHGYDKAVSLDGGYSVWRGSRP